MMTFVNQRWRRGRDTYRPSTEVIDTRAYEIAEILDDRTAKVFVLQHHYAGTYPAARYRLGLYRGAALVGVAVFSHPCSDFALTNVFPGSPRESVELGRFVLEDSVPGNGETWFLARCFEALREKGLHGVISFSDPVSRLSATGSLIFPGHIGTIYQAHNAVYLGRGRGRILRLLPNGTVYSPRAGQKILSMQKGWEYAVHQLICAGAPEPGARTLSSWYREWLPKVTRPLKHAGNHKYAWALNRQIRKILPTSLPYPKVLDVPSLPHEIAS